METSDGISGVLQVFGGFPLAVLWSPTYPIHQVAEFPAFDLRVKDLLHFVFLVTIDSDGGGQEAVYAQVEC